MLHNRSLHLAIFPLLGLLAAVLPCAGFAQVPDAVPTAVVTPLSGGRVSFQLLASFPTTNPHRNYHVHAYGAPSVHVVTVTEESAGALIPGLPAEVRLFDVTTGTFVVVKAGDPAVQLTGALVFPDQFMTFNCGSSLFVAGTSGATAPMATYYNASSGSTMYVSYTVSPIGSIRQASGSNTYLNVRTARATGLQSRSGSYMNSTGTNALPEAVACTAEVTHYLGY